MALVESTSQLQAPRTDSDRITPADHHDCTPTTSPHTTPNEHGTCQAGAAKPARQLRFSSLLPIAFRDELERVLFFNQEQPAVEEALIRAVRRYGVPTIIENGPHLRLRVPAFPSVQSLYSLDDAGAGGSTVLAGAAIFVRESLESVLVLHLAVHEDYSARGAHAGLLLAPRLLAAVRDCFRRTRGVAELRLCYPRPARIPLTGR